VSREEAALSTLEQFCLQALPQYEQKRDFPAEPVTSKLSLFYDALVTSSAQNNVGAK
jgi:deoxyribodipyrimidine photolyase